MLAWEHTPGMLRSPKDDHGNNISAAQNQHDAFDSSQLVKNEPETEAPVEGVRLLTYPAIICYQPHHPQTPSRPSDPDVGPTQLHGSRRSSEDRPPPSGNLPQRSQFLPFPDPFI